MSDLLDIVQKLSDTQAIIRRTEAFLIEDPDDATILATLGSLSKRAAELETQFLSQAHREHLDVCSYRIFLEDSADYAVLAVGNALSDFQRWFSTVYDALKSGPKRRAHIAPEIVNDSTLSFAFSFTGSVGVALTLPSERMLLDNDLQLAMRKTVEMLRAESSDQVHNFANELGAASVVAFSKWVGDHVAAGTGADIKWLREEEEIVGIRANAEHMRSLQRAIEETSDTEEKVLEIKGTLVGADTERHTFHMTFEEADEIRGSMSESIGAEYTVELPRIYSATVRKTSSVSYSTDKETIRYHLLELKKV